MAIENEKRSTPPTKSAASIKLNNKLDDLVSTGNRRTAEFKQLARDAIRYAYGDQNAGRTRKKNWEYPVINRMYADILQEVAILSGNNPRVTALPVEDDDIDAARAAGTVLQGIWNKDLRMRTKIIAALLDARLSGISVAMPFWEERARWNEEQAAATGQGWEGKLHVNIINPDYFFCDPNVESAIDIPTEALFLGTQRWVDKVWAANRWPKYKRHLSDMGELDKIQLGARSKTQETGRVSNESNFDRSTGTWAGKDTSGRFSEREIQERLANILLNHADSPANRSSGQQASESLVRVQMIFFRDYAMEEEPALTKDAIPGEGSASHLIRNRDGSLSDRERPIIGDDGNIQDFGLFQGEFPQEQVRQSYKRPKYPSGRMVIRLSDDVIVEDIAYPYKNWPFMVMPYYPLPHIWNGINAVEMSRGFQDWMNIIASHMTNYIKFFADPIVMVENGALADDFDKKKKLTVPNWAGAILRLKRGALNRGAIKRDQPPSLPPTLFQLFDLFKNEDQDLKGIHDIAQGRASRGEQTLGELQLLNRNTRQRIAMQGAFLDEFLNQIAIHLMELMQKHLPLNSWVRYTGVGEEGVSGSLKWTEKLADSKFDIFLEPASTLPTDEERTIARYLQAAEIMGPAIYEDLLKAMKIPNVEEIMQKHQVLGPLQTLLEQAAQSGTSTEDLMGMIQRMMGLEAEASPQPPTTKPQTTQPQAVGTTEVATAAI